MSDSESLTTLDEIEIELEQSVEQKRPYFFQLDVLKAIAIAFVVMDHSLYWDIKGQMGSLFWERLSIPFFLIVMGFNMAYSFKYSGATTLRELYSEEYFKGKIVRYVLPFAVLYMGSILVGLYTGLIRFSEYTLIGTLPFWGPGNWFIALLFGSIVVFPFVYWLFKKQPVLTLILCFLGEIVLQAILFIWFPYPIESALEAFIVSAVRQSVIFYLPAIGLGLWFSEGYNLREKRNWFMFLYVPICLMFMVDYVTISPNTHRGILGALPNSFGEFINFVQVVFAGDYSLLFYGYAAILFICAMILIPQKPNGKLQRFVQQVGRASYHILLFQIFYMSIVYYTVSIDDAISHQIPVFPIVLGWPSDLYYIPFYLMNLTICFAGGLLWYKAEKRAAKRGKPWYQHAWMIRTALLFGALMSIVMMGVSLELIAEYMGLNYWAEHHGPLFVLNEITGPGVMATVLAIIFFIGLCMTCLYKAFTMDDDEIPL
ncbi:MAG: acyltransferase [Candidatus Thorarchaeota archaeon]|nr:MAG: acyltransferase [Candidatus Thorarchaeota archaeon]